MPPPRDAAPGTMAAFAARHRSVRGVLALASLSACARRAQSDQVVSGKIERTYSKDKILELYLNEIYLGLGAYGIAAASLTYFDKAVNELTVPEAAYLAALPKAPSNYHPFRQRERAIERRNWVLDRMAEAGFVKAADAEKAKRSPLGVTSKSTSTHTFAAEYFLESQGYLQCLHS